ARAARAAARLAHPCRTRWRHCWPPNAPQLVLYILARSGAPPKAPVRAVPPRRRRRRRRRRRWWWQRGAERPRRPISVRVSKLTT
ncbi:hypothetical protein B484DRAFT_419055, partial [Ochromonadaceae sp. CCMP2298]